MTFTTYKTDRGNFELFLRERYGLRNITVEEVDTAPGGRFRIHNITAEGSKEEFICKINRYDPINPPYLGVVRVCDPVKQAVVMRHLEKSSLICSHPKPSILGNDAETYGDCNTIALVMTYLPGIPLSQSFSHYDSRDMYDFGVFAGHFRRIMEDFKHDAFPKLSRDEILENEDLPHLLRICEPMKDEAKREQLRHILRGCVEKIEARMANLPTGVIHGDLWPGNVIRLESSLKDGTPLDKFGLIDFDLCRSSFLVHDFANTFVHDSIQANTDDIPSLTRPMADGYCSVWSVTEDEKRTVQFSLCLRVARILLFAVNIPIDHPSPGCQFIRTLIDKLFHRVVALWEGDNEEYYRKWFGKE